MKRFLTKLLAAILIVTFLPNYTTICNANSTEKGIQTIADNLETYTEKPMAKAAEVKDYMGASKMVNETILPISKPAIPENFNAIPGNSQVELTWDAVSKAQGYNIYIGISPKDYSIVKKSKENKFTVKNLTNGKMYYFVITAYNKYGESEKTKEIGICPGKVIVWDRTKVLDSKDINAISFSNDGNTLSIPKNLKLAKDLRVNDILSSGVSSKTPTGFLRRVIAIANTKNSLKVQTTSAAMDEAIEECDTTISTDITEEIVKLPAQFSGGNVTKEEILSYINKYKAENAVKKSVSPTVMQPSATPWISPTMSVGIKESFEKKFGLSTVTGSIESKISLIISVKIRKFSVEEAVFKIRLEEDIGLKVELIKEFKISDKDAITLFALKKPFVFIAGGVPIVVWPTIKLVSGFEAKITAEGMVTGSVGQKGWAEAGIRYSSSLGKWQPVSDYKTNFKQIEMPKLKDGAKGTLKIYLGPEVEINILEVPGLCTAKVHGFLELTKKPKSWNAEILKLDGGIEAAADYTISVKKIFKKLDYKFNIQFKLFEFKKNIWEWIENLENGHYYRLTKPMNWFEAERTAVSWGAHLVTINDTSENAWIVSNLGDSSYFIGYNDIGHEGLWTWVSGQYSGFANWFQHKRGDWEPNNVNGGENAATINYNDASRNEYGPGKWNDVPESMAIMGVVEKEE